MPKKARTRPKKRRPGRPALPAAERQDAALMIRMRPGELKALKRLAKAEGTTVGRYVRALLRDNLRRRGLVRSGRSR